MCLEKVKVKMCIYSPDIPVNMFSGLYIIYPQVLELALSQSHLPREYAAQFSAAVAIRMVPIFRSTWYPLLLSRQRQCGFKACPRLLHMTSAAGIEPQTPRFQVQCLNHSATCSTKTIGFIGWLESAWKQVKKKH